MTRHLFALLAAFALSSSACNNPGSGGAASSGSGTASSAGSAGTAAAAPSTGDLKSEEDKTLYALGLLIGRNVTPFSLTATELEVVKRGLTDSVNGNKPAVELQVYGPKVDEMARARRGKMVEKEKAKAEKEKEKAKGYLEQAAKEPGAQKTDSGLIIKVLKPGTGAQPTAADTVKVHYEGKLTDGTVFDSSLKRGEPVEFPLGGVIPCWREGVAKMNVGEKAKLVCPSSIAYGDMGQPPTIPGGATLVFEVELLGITPGGAAGGMGGGMTPPPPPPAKK